MALTSNDETDLLLPLYDGLDETPRFATFLDRMRRRTGAPRVELILDGEKRDDMLAPEVRATLRPYRAYALAELTGNESASVDARIVMFPLSDGTRGWLVIGRDRPCTASDSALLSSVAPYVQSVVAIWRERQRDHAAAALSSDGLARTGTGWILFDAEARVLAIEPETRKRLANDAGITAQRGERLRGILSPAERALAEAAARFAQSAQGERAQSQLLAEPRTETLLEPVDPDSETARLFPGAAMIAWCRFEPTTSKARTSALAGLHDLPRREAELALALADGLSISDAAQRMGLTLETARNYSKRLYTKLGVSGQPQLVRLVHVSSAALA
jgi:DNA-binding CsgD family transcriptional regulator